MDRGDGDSSDVRGRDHGAGHTQFAAEHRSGRDDPAVVDHHMAAVGLVDQPAEIEGLLVNVIQERTGDDAGQLRQILGRGRPHRQFVVTGACLTDEVAARLPLHGHPKTLAGQIGPMGDRVGMP